MNKNAIFRSELTGLEPGTDYRFRIGLDSAEKKFRTMPSKATNTIEFVSGGDAGVGVEAKHTNEIAARQSPSFVFWEAISLTRTACSRQFSSVPCELFEPID